MSSLPLARLQETAGFSADRRFQPIAGGRAETVPAQAPVDPVAEAFERGFAEGVASATGQAAERERERDAQRGAIELALYRMDRQGAQEMAERLRQTVIALCEEAVLPLAVDPAGLAARIDRAIVMLQRVDDERRVLLHPDDWELVAPHLPPGLQVTADPTVERGALRIETADGGIEDGPSQWRRILHEAFREC